MPLSDYENRKPRTSATSDPNPVLIDGESYLGTFVGFSKPFQSPGWQGAEPVWKVVLLYDLEGVGRYKEFVRVSTYDGAPGRDGRKFKCARLFLRLQSLVGVKNQTEAKRVNLESIVRLPVKVTAAKDDFGNVVIASVTRVQAQRFTPPAPSGGLKHVTAIPGTFEVPVTLDEVRLAFLATGRSEVAFDAFLVVYGGPGANVSPAACKSLLRAVAALPKVEGPTFGQQVQRAGLEVTDDVPEEPGSYAEELPL